MLSVFLVLLVVLVAIQYGIRLSDGQISGLYARYRHLDRMPTNSVPMQAYCHWSYIRGRCLQAEPWAFASVLIAGCWLIFR